MDTHITVEAIYPVFPKETIKLPEGYTMSDIKEVSLHYDEGLVQFTDGTEMPFYFDGNPIDNADWATPDVINYWDAEGDQSDMVSLP